MSKKHKRKTGSKKQGFLDVRMGRRDLMQNALGAAGVFLAGRMGLPTAAAAAEAATPLKSKAKAVIQIWLWGGPAHTDTFDPKPESGSDFHGPYDKPIETNVKGIRIAQTLPELAKIADKYSILRGMTHGNNGHETASYMTQTGRKPGGRVVYPCAGAVVSLFKGYAAGYKGLLPPYIVMTRPQGRFSEAGFLGSAYKPFATGGNPGRDPFLVEGVAAPGITRERQKGRRDLLGKLDSTDPALKNQMGALKESEAKAYDMILGDAGKVFDLTQEKDELRERYGRNTFGQSCLMARRLVEKGVRYVTINAMGWDTHKKHFESMRQKLPEMDKGFAALLGDLSSLGLLDSTIVWWGGEFGRKPKIDWKSPWNGGRGHHGHCFTSVVAGGGFQGGQVVGASDEKGWSVKDRPVYPWDMLGSMYQLLGIDPAAKLPHPQGLDVRVCPTEKDKYESGGLLKEIM